MKLILDNMVEEGWLISQNHPTLDLTIYNYSQKTQYESNWNKHTLMCRGLVLNSKGDIVARPFPKFFNYEEVAGKVPTRESYEIFEKMDGSLGIFFWYADEKTETLQPVFASRGSFTSEQAVKGWEMLQKLPYHDLAYGHTHMFEIIYPENRIVVDYGAQEKLVLLGVMHTSGGTEIPHKNLEEHLGDSFELVKAYHSENGWEHLKSLNEPNKEGFVIRFNSGFRMKIKFEDYVRLHRIITQVSNIDIWERLMKDEPLDDILEKVPDEFFDWVRQWEKALKFGYVMQEKEARKWFDRLNEEIVFAERKEQAIWILGFVPQEYQSIMFSMLDGRDYSQAIWKMLRPEWSKPFANSEN
jgi:RNA ligase